MNTGTAIPETEQSEWPGSFDVSRHGAGWIVISWTEDDGLVYSVSFHVYNFGPNDVNFGERDVPWKVCR